MNWKIIGSSISAFCLGGTIVVLSFLIGDNITVKVISMAIIVLGIASGWAVGIIISPYDVSESKQFTTFTKIFVTFSSGYLIGKLDKLIDQIFQTNFLLVSVNGFRIISFLAVFIITVIITFVYRVYARV